MLGSGMVSFHFKTPRLAIRPWIDSDRAALARMAMDSDMMRFVTQGRPWVEAEVDEFLERQARHVARHGISFGAVEDRASAEVIGLAGMQPHDDGQFELGWWVWKEHWGKGYATEAIEPFVDHARQAMRLAQVVAIIDPPNEASKRVAEKLGMEFVCIKSARQTIATRDDIPIAYYAMNLKDQVE